MVNPIHPNFAILNREDGGGAFKGQPAVQEQSLEDNQTQSWLGWAATLASNAMESIIPFDDEPAPLPITIPQDDMGYYYVENEQGELTPRWIYCADKLTSFMFGSSEVSEEGESPVWNSAVEFEEEDIIDLYEIGEKIKNSTVATKFNELTKEGVGKTIAETGKRMIGENVGMLVGAAFPEASMAYAAGKAAASNFVGESENKSIIVEGAGVAAALTATALSTGLSYLTGTPMEYGQALGYMVTAAGTIAGGMNGLEAVGEKVPENYIPRTAAYLVTTGAVGGVVKAAADVLPGPVSTVTTVAGSVLKPVVGLAAYSAPEVISLADTIIHPMPPKENSYDPSEFIKNIAKNAQGDLPALVTSMAGNLVESPLISSIIQTLFVHTIDNRLATNAIVRAVNDFVNAIQDKSIQEKIRELKATPDEIKRDALKKEIVELIAKLVAEKYGPLEKKLAKYLQSKSDSSAKGLAATIANLMSRKEKAIIGRELSDAKQTQALLEALIPSLIPMIGVYAKREVGAKDLSPKEIETFYQNFNAMIFAPYNDYSIVRGVQGLISTAIPFMQKYAQFIPEFLAEKIGSSMVDPIITLDDDPEFDIPATTTQKVQAEPKKSAWRSIREKLSFIKFMVKLGGIKDFMKAASSAFVNLIMMRKAKEPMNSGNSSGT